MCLQPLQARYVEAMSSTTNNTTVHLYYVLLALQTSIDEACSSAACVLARHDKTIAAMLVKSVAGRGGEASVDDSSRGPRHDPEAVLIPVPGAP